MKQDFYQTLGISRQASQDDIKKAYRQAAMKYHPDRNAGNPTMEKKFKEVNEAYQTLSDPQSRKRYDQFWSADMGAGFWGWRGGASAWGGFWGFEDLFSQFGSGGFEDLFSQSSRSSAVNLDTVVEQKIPFLDFLLGGKFEYRQVNGKILTITVPPKTEPGTKFRVAGKGRVSGSRVGDLFFELHPEFPRGTLSWEMHEKLEKIRQELAALR